MTIGIYKLNFTGTDKAYIGQCSTDIEKIRYKQHLRSFKNGTASKKLQEAYNTYGSPTIEILCECTEEELDKTENEAIEIFNSVNKGFNTLETAGAFPDNRGENCGASKYTNEQIISVFKLLVYYPEKLYSNISEISEISVSTIEAISGGKNHRWLKDKFPEEYTLLMGLKGNRKHVNISKTAKDMGIIYPAIISPNGTKYNVENLNKFSREHQLDCGTLCKVLNKKRKSHKGWKLA